MRVFGRGVDLLVAGFRLRGAADAFLVLARVRVVPRGVFAFRLLLGPVTLVAIFRAVVEAVLGNVERFSVSSWATLVSFPAA